MAALEPQSEAKLPMLSRRPSAAHLNKGLTFHLFPSLPAELRLKIWDFSFQPRVIALHTRKSHYADDSRDRGTPKWQTRNGNPAQLSTCVESRQLALERYTVSLPLAVDRTCERAGDSSLDRHRRLYLSLHDDTVVVLGELNVYRIQVLLRYLREHDPRGEGLRRLGVSAGCFAHEGGGQYLRVYAKTIFRDLDELVLCMYNERMPPESWEDGGECELLDCRDTDHYRRFVLGKGSELRKNEEWLRVGRRSAELRVVDLIFWGKHGACFDREVVPTQTSPMVLHSLLAANLFNCLDVNR